MPLFTYFIVAVPALVGLLYLADAELGPAPASMPLSTATPQGLDKPAVKVSGVPILTSNESQWIAPDMSAVDAMARVDVRPGAEPPKQEARIERPKRKVARAPEPPSYQPTQNMFAQTSGGHDSW